MASTALNTADNQPLKWSSLFICFLITLGQICFGYPASIISTTLGEPPFLRYMHLSNAEGNLNSNATSLEGATNGVFQAGSFLGVFLTAYILDHYGRKKSVHANAIIGLLGGALLTGSRNIAMFIVGRFFTGMSSIGFLALTPCYTAELAPPRYRGLFVGFNGVNIASGYAIAAWTGAGFQFASDETARWRGPLGVYLFFPLLMIGIMFFVPESPRWLLLQGRIEEAREVIERLHRDKKHPNDDFVQFEFYQMQKQAEVDRTLDASWLGMFSKRYRKRTLLVIFYAFIGQSTAILVVNNYGPTFYSALGYTTTPQLFFQAGWVTTGLLACTLGALYLDKLGRRPLMLFGVGACVIVLSIVTACVAVYTAHPTYKSVAAAGVAFLYLFNFVYNVGVDVGGNVFYAEAFPNHVRSKGVALANASLALADLVYLQTTATAFAHIGWRFFLVFICVSAVGFVVLWFWLPETKGVPLEEMAAIFGDQDDIAVRSGDRIGSLGGPQERKAFTMEGGDGAGGGVDRRADHEEKV